MLSAVGWGMFTRAWWYRNWKWALPVAGLSLVLFGPLLLLIVPAVYLGLRRSRQRTEQMKHVCSALGFEFEEAQVLDLAARFGGFPHFAASRGTAQHLMTGSVAQHPLTVMEHYYGPKSRNGETLALFPEAAKGLPDFELSPGWGSLGEKIQGALGHTDINFRDNEEFSNAYALYGTDEPGIRRTFDTRVLKYLTANPGWSVETSGGGAMIFRSCTLCRPAEVPAFLAEALGVLGELTRPH